VLADRVGEVAEALAQPLDGREVRVGLDARAKRLDQRLETGDIEAALAAEVPEDQPVRDAGRLGDLIDRDVVVVAVAEDLEGGRDQLEPPLSCPLGCRRTRGDWVRLARVDPRRQATTR
jgi:hypothetical protein